MIKNTVASTFLLMTASAVIAQDASDLFLLPVSARGTTVELGSPVRLTDRDGYDNQPCFSADGEALYFTSMHEGQTDIWAIGLDGLAVTRAPRAVFETPESEYSPTPIPGDQALSVIRVETDGTQRLWRLPLGGAEPEVILPQIRPVGYHAWSGRELVLFVLDEPHRLVRVSAEPPQEARTVASDVGRALHRIPGDDAFSFVHKAAEGRGEGWRLTRLGLEDDALSHLVRTLEGREDLAWSADGSVWSADGSRLLRWRRGEADWREIADLGHHGISGITRLAFDSTGSRLALVAQRGPAAVGRLDIVDKAIEHHGGERFSASETSLELCSRSGCFDVLSRVDGGRYRHQVRGQRGDIIQQVVVGNDEVRLWRQGESVAVTAEDEGGLRDWAMARIYFPFLPFRLNDPSVRKQDLGVETWNGRELHKVKVTFDAGSSTDADDVYLYWFEDTGLLVQFAYSYSGSPGGLRFRQLVNPRRVGGLLFHDQKNFGVEGDLLTVDRLTPETAPGLRLVSTVELRNITVHGLGAD